MLTAIRERATGWIAWVIVFFITVPFALWGINSYFQGANELAVATVNGEEISNTAYQQELATQRRALIDRFGSGFDPALFDIKKRVVDDLVERALLTQFVSTQNVRLSDEQLRKRIQTALESIGEGEFSQTQYLQLLSANGWSVQGFEQSQRRSGAVNQLQQGIVDSSFFTERERDQLLLLNQQSRIAQYTVLEANKFAEEFDVTDADVQAYHEENISRYQTESRIKVDYIELSVESLSRSITPSEEEINGLYEETKDQYKQAKSREASHILVSVSQSADEDEKKNKLELAHNILQQANQGEDFAALALQYSDDPGSKEKGGDLGVIVRGQMVKPFEDAVFEMVEGEIKGVIESQFGYHIIKLTSLSEEYQQTLDQVRDEVLEDVVKLQAERMFAELSESFKNVVFEAPDNLTTAADEMNLPIQSSDWFTESAGSGIAEEAAIRRTAFSEDVLNENLVGPAIEIGFDKLFALQKSEYEEARSKLVEDVKSEIITTIKLEKSRSKLQQVGPDLLSSLKSSVKDKASWENFIQRQGLEALPLPDKRPEIPANLAQLGDIVFTLPVPQEGEVEFSGVTLDNGGYVLVVLEKVERGELTAADDAQRTMVQQQLLERDGSAMFNQFKGWLRRDADITILEQQL